MMGVGKSTVGRHLARRLRLPFVDTDSEIERAANLSIAELFERYGEDQFRDGERRVIARLLGDAPKVVATGGGAFIDDLTRALILDRGHTVWLDADIATLAARVAKRPGQRPLIGRGNPFEVLSGLAAARNPIYALAHVHVHSQSNGHSSAADLIIDEIAKACDILQG